MKTRKKIRLMLGGFIILLLLSGITAFPIRTEIQFLMNHLNSFPSFLQDWIKTVNDSLASIPDIVLYGTDWLAFGHIIIALFFIPVFIDPVKYKINCIIGIIACAGVFPLAFICGAIRGIPFFHQLIDCSFGLIGGCFLYYIYFQTKKLEISLKHKI